MAWVVDSCILLDVALDDARWGHASARHLEARLTEGLVVCPVSTIEIAPEFGGDVEMVRTFLSILGARSDTPWLDADTREATRAWAAYVAARRAGHGRKRPTADILIGAFAQQRKGLITRNVAEIRRWFGPLPIVDPAKPDKRP